MNPLHYIRNVLLITALILYSFSPVHAATPRDRGAFHHRHFNSGGVCLLSSYGFMLEYANSTCDDISEFDNFDVMSEYLVFHNTLEPVEQLSPDFMRKHAKAGEAKVSKAINDYCMKRRWSGYMQIRNFHQWLKTHSRWSSNLEIVEMGKAGELPENIKARLIRYLRRNADKNALYDYAALICYKTKSGPHSVFMGYDSDFFIRDVNFYDRYTDSTASFDYSFNDDSNRIFEYLLFKVVRPVSGKPGKWKRPTQSRLRAIRTEANNKYILSAGIPVKSIKMDFSSQCGKDGTVYYTEIFLKSKSNPSLHIEIGNYFGGGQLRINGKIEMIGLRRHGSVFEYDLKQIAPDLEIVAYQPNFDFSKLQYQ